MQSHKLKKGEPVIVHDPTLSGKITTSKGVFSHYWNVDPTYCYIKLSKFSMLLTKAENVTTTRMQ